MSSSPHKRRKLSQKQVRAAYEPQVASRQSVASAREGSDAGIAKTNNTPASKARSSSTSGIASFRPPPSVTVGGIEAISANVPYETPLANRQAQKQQSSTLVRSEASTLPSDRSPLVASDDDQDKPTEYARDLSSSSPQSVLCRGLYRFVVREIKQTVPFVIAMVEELPEELPDSLDSTDDKDASLVRVCRSTISRGQRATTNHVPLGTIAHGRRQRAATMSIFNKKGLKKRLPSFKSFRAMWWMNCPWYQQMNDCLPWPILTDQTDEMQRDLQVGRPHLPPKSVFGKGTEVEYFWNEEKSMNSVKAWWWKIPNWWWAIETEKNFCSWQ